MDRSMTPNPERRIHQACVRHDLDRQHVTQIRMRADKVQVGDVLLGAAGYPRIVKLERTAKKFIVVHLSPGYGAEYPVDFVFTILRQNNT